MRDTDRRSFLRAAAVAPALAVPMVAGGAPVADPVFALIAEWRAEGKRLDESTADVDGEHYGELTLKVWHAAPTTLAGLAALAAVFHEQAANYDEADVWLDTICVALAGLPEAELAAIVLGAQASRADSTAGRGCA